MSVKQIQSDLNLAKARRNQADKSLHYTLEQRLANMSAYDKEIKKLENQLKTSLA